jgi:hypothetical protein
VPARSGVNARAPWPASSVANADKSLRVATDGDDVLIDKGDATYAKFDAAWRSHLPGAVEIKAADGDRRKRKTKGGWYVTPVHTNIDASTGSIIFTGWARRDNLVCKPGGRRVHGVSFVVNESELADATINYASATEDENGSNIGGTYKTYNVRLLPENGDYDAEHVRRHRRRQGGGSNGGGGNDGARAAVRAEKNDGDVDADDDGGADADDDGGVGESRAAVSPADGVDIDGDVLYCQGHTWLRDGRYVRQYNSE